MLDALPNHVELPLEAIVGLDRRRPADEELPEDGLRGDRAGTQAAVVGRHVAPAEQPLSLFGDNVRNGGFHQPPRLIVAREEHQPGAIGALGRQVDVEAGCLPAEEPVRDLNQDAGAVSRVGFAAAGAAVLEVDEHLERVPDNRVRAMALHVHDEADAAGVMLVPGVVEAAGGGCQGVSHSLL